MPTDEGLEWSEFAELIGRFPEEQLAQTVINASCCHGLHAIKSVRWLSPGRTPFGLVGPADPISFPQAISITKRFYKKLLNGRKINDIVREINMEMSKHLLDCITGQGFRELDGVSAAAKADRTP